MISSKPEKKAHISPLTGFSIFVFLWTCIAGAGAQSFSIDSFEADGDWCPMAHCNRMDDSYQEIHPLLTVGEVQKIESTEVSPEAWVLLGCVTGETAAVCAYDSPDYPAVAAFNLEDGAVLWTSPIEDLPMVEDGRRTGGLLLAKLAVNGNPVRRYVYAGNRAHFVSYLTATGDRVWRRNSSDITPSAPEGVGRPVSMSYTDANELVAVTFEGWVVKLNPVNGSTIDAYRLETAVPIDGELVEGYFSIANSPIIVGNTLYAVVDFIAGDPGAVNPDLAPVYVVRVDLRQPNNPGSEHKIKPLLQPDTPATPTPDRAAIGVGSAGGSPPGMITDSGSVLLFADADAFVDGSFKPAVAAVEDVDGVLTRRWRATLTDPNDNDILAAPALYAPTKTLIVNTRKNIYVFRGVDTLSGPVSPPAPIKGGDLTECGNLENVETIFAGAPLSITLNRGTNELVVYTNFREPHPGQSTHAYYGAFAVPTRGPSIGRPVWCELVAEAPPGQIPPRAYGVVGQPSLFLTGQGDSQISNLIVNTFASGTYIFRSAQDTGLPADLNLIGQAITNSPTAAELAQEGYVLSDGVMLWPEGCPEEDPGCVRYVNNPITRYGHAYLSAGEGGAFSAKLRLDGSDAFVLFGYSPPPTTYYSHTMNQFRRFYPELSDYFDTVSSIGLSINPINMNTLTGPHDSFFALITAADHEVASRVQKSLVEAGIPEASISRILVPERFFNAHTTPTPDHLQFVTRLTFRTPEEHQRVLDYIDQGVGANKLIFFNGPDASGDVADSDLQSWEENLRTDDAEAANGMNQVLDFLVARIAQTYGAEGYTLQQVGSEVLKHQDPEVKCRQAISSCNFDAPDALYARFFCSESESGACLHRLPNYKDFFVIAGVDHHRFDGGKLGTYFSYAVTRFADLAGIATLTDVQMQGSAADYLNGTQVNPDNLFAMKIARACDGEPYCLEVPWGQDGIPQLDFFMITSRIYLDKVTATAPNPENFVPARILWFRGNN